MRPQEYLSHLVGLFSTSGLEVPQVNVEYTSVDMSLLVEISIAKEGDDPEYVK